MNINDLKVGDIVYIREDLESWQVYGNLMYYPKMHTGLARVEYVSTDYLRIHQDEVGYLYSAEMINWKKTAKLNNLGCFKKITQYGECGNEITKGTTYDGREITVKNSNEKNDIEKAVMLLMLKQRGVTYGDVKREVEKVKVKWVPKDGEKYYWVNGYFEINWRIWQELRLDRKLLESGNCFKTEEEAEEKLEKIKEVLKGE